MRGILRGEPCGDNVRAEPLLGRGVTHLPGLPGESHRGKEECNDECNDEVPKRWSSSTGAASTGSPALFGLGGGCANRMVTGIVPMKDASCQARTLLCSAGHSAARVFAKMEPLTLFDFMQIVQKKLGKLRLNR